MVSKITPIDSKLPVRQVASINPDFKTVGERLRNWRYLRGLKMQELSNIIGVSQGCLSDIENGKSAPSYKTLCAYKHFYPRVYWMKIFFW